MITKKQVFGPYNTLKRAYKDGGNLFEAVGYYLKSIDSDYYGHHKSPRHEKDSDGVIQLFFGRVPIETICDELQFTVGQIEARAKQLGMPTDGSEYNEEHINIARNMFNNGCSYKEVCEVLEIGEPKTFYTGDPKELSEMHDNAAKKIEQNNKTNQTELFNDGESDERN